MQAADTSEVEQAIQDALADESATHLFITLTSTPLTVIDARRIIDCLQENTQFQTLYIYNYYDDIIHNNDAASVLNAFLDGLPLCTSLTTVNLLDTNLGNDGLEHLVPLFYNTSITSLDLAGNNIQGRRGGEVIGKLLSGNKTLLQLHLYGNPIGSDGAVALGRGLAGNNAWLQQLCLNGCNIGNKGLSNLLATAAALDGMNNNKSSLTDLDLTFNHIEGVKGGQQITLLLQRLLPTLKSLRLCNNPLGPLGAMALAPGLAAASNLESLDLCACRLGNNGMANLIPDGQVNRSLTNLDLRDNNVQGTMGGENAIIALVSRCTNLDSINVDRHNLSRNQRSRLDLLLARKRLCTEASALGGSPFSILFRFVEKVHRHEHGLSAILVILQNDGDDYFCTAHNRARLNE